ncbi:CpsD/CapB family tyrosine-protein kinase [Niveispirillum sp.]|uniref:CpsD/CapB family tyrosine-protein kinase n=1 Tax=Niveispirillum sp. TaxID=1917217 RepID=UPI001B659537|nr:CpsD/CapB family tyrosine-protein kinase [Niveispirillum sp.]MBP7339010.1 CpsD/CapB family tyrosine-protein kinase [Niveispirillum sp.]
MSITATPARGGTMPPRPEPPARRGLSPARLMRRAGLTGAAALSGLAVGHWLEPAAGLLAGFAVLIAGLFLTCQGRNARNFNNTDDVEAATDLTVLAELPEFTDTPDALAQVLRGPDGDIAARLQALHRHLLATSADSSPMRVAITSAESGEGRSLMAAMLGRFLASRGHRVLLIDADWCDPVQHLHFHIPSAPGLADLLSRQPPGLDEVVRTDPVSGLDLITTGTGKLSARKLLGEPMQRLLADLSDSYELVLLDLPPIMVAADTLLLSRIVHRLLFVVRWRHTRRNRAMGALARLRKARGTVSGIVLTRVGNGNRAP